MSSATGPKSEMERKMQWRIFAEASGDEPASERCERKAGGREERVEGMEGGGGRSVKTCESIRRGVSFCSEKKSSAPREHLAPVQ